MRSKISNLKFGIAKARRGLALPELLISVAIAAALLTASAVAIDGSFIAYRVNEEQSTLIQSARLTLNRISVGVRTSKLHQPHTPALLAQFTSGHTVADTGLDMFDSNGVELTFTYDAPHQRLLAIYNGASHVLASGVTAFTVTLEPMRSAESIRTGGPFDLVRRATVAMSIKTAANTAQSSETTGKQTVTLSASVVPRRNTW